MLKLDSLSAVPISFSALSLSLPLRDRASPLLRTNMQLLPYAHRCPPLRLVSESLSVKVMPMLVSQAGAIQTPSAVNVKAQGKGIQAVDGGIKNERPRSRTEGEKDISHIANAIPSHYSSDCCCKRANGDYTRNRKGLRRVRCRIKSIINILLFVFLLRFVVTYSSFIVYFTLSGCSD